MRVRFAEISAMAAAGSSLPVAFMKELFATSIIVSMSLLMAARATWAGEGVEVDEAASASSRGTFRSEQHHKYVKVAVQKPF